MDISQACGFARHEVWAYMACGLYAVLCAPLRHRRLDDYSKVTWTRTLGSSCPHLRALTKRRHKAPPISLRISHLIYGSLRRCVRFLLWMKWIICFIRLSMEMDAVSFLLIDLFHSLVHIWNKLFVVWEILIFVARNFENVRLDAYLLTLEIKTSAYYLVCI